MRPAILLTGVAGQLGSKLARTLMAHGRVIPLTRRDLDLTSIRAIRTAVRAARPDIIVNAAAYTAVDRAERELELCAAVNVTAPGVLAEEAARLGAAMVHYSTDYVFDGRSTRPYREDDPTDPLNFYGLSKLGGEHAIAAVGGSWLVLRTSWVYGAHGANFLRTMLRLAREREELRIVADQRGAPTCSWRLAQATARIVEQLAQGDSPAAALAPLSGVYHLTAAGETSWYDFARAILAGDPRREEQRVRRVIPVPTSEYPTPAKRPLYSLLDNTKVRETFGVALPEWREDLASVLQRI